MSVECLTSDLKSAPKLKEGKDPFAAAFRTARSPMLITDPRQPDNPIVFVNDAFTRLTGYSRSEAVGRNCRFLQGPDTDRATTGMIRARLKAGEGFETEILNYRKDGSCFWNALVVSPIHDEAGDLVYYFASQSDVSDQKKAAQELIRAKERLEELVAQTTRDLHAALDQKVALLHEVDHRVKNNLQIISSLVLLKARRIKDEGGRRALYDLAERISALSAVHRLLYSISDVGHFDLADFLTDLTSELTSALPPGQVTLDMRVGAIAVPSAKAAPLALLMNELVGNAVAHAFPDRRQGRLLIEAKKLEGGLRIIAEDDGVGIDNLSPPEGGIGKTLMDMLVRQLKGRIAWESASPGTRAVIVLPLDVEEAQF